MSHPVYRCKAENMVANQELEVKVLMLMAEEVEVGVINPLMEAGKQENAIRELQIFENTLEESAGSSGITLVQKQIFVVVILKKTDWHSSMQGVPLSLSNHSTSNSCSHRFVYSYCSVQAYPRIASKLISVTSVKIAKG